MRKVPELRGLHRPGADPCLSPSRVPVQIINSNRPASESSTIRQCLRNALSWLVLQQVSSGRVGHGTLAKRAAL